MSQAQRFLCAAICSLSFCSFAQMPVHKGFYLGLAGGYSRADYSEVSFMNGIQFGSIGETGFAPSIQAGYEFNRWAALELSVIYDARIFFNTPNIAPSSPQAYTKNNVVYLAFRPRWFFYEDLYVFSKLGLGYVVNSNVWVNDVEALDGDEYFRPVYGAGLGLRPGVHWQLELSWLQTPQNLSVRIPTTNFVGFAIQYLF